MAVKNIIKLGSPVLRQISEKVEKIDRGFSLSLKI